MKKKDLIGLVLIPALALSGCSKVPNLFHETSARVSGFVDDALGRADPAEFYKRHPDYLARFLQDFSGTEGLSAVKNPVYIRFDIKGKSDTLIVVAQYALTPDEDGGGIPDLTGFSVEDTREHITYNYAAVNIDPFQSAPSPLLNQPKQYRLDDKKI